jgi:hypothetical protein
MKFGDYTVCGRSSSSIKACLKVNKKLNQRNFNLFVLPCPGWGVRGSILSKIKKLLTSDSVLIGDIPYLFVFDMR